MWQGILTILFIIGFIIVCIWAFNPKNKKRFEEDAQLPFLDDKKKSKKSTDNKRQK